MSSFKLAKSNKEFLITRNRFYDYYKLIICPDLLLKQNYLSVNEIPTIEKIVINNSSKFYITEKKSLIPALLGLQMITGQKAKLTYATKSIASFKLRKNQLLGAKVTLRDPFLYVFLDLLFTLVLPKLRDFSGFSFSKSRIKSETLSLGFSNLMIFPEFEKNFEFFDFFKGLTINISFSTCNQYDLVLLCTAFQVPLDSLNSRDS